MNNFIFSITDIFSKCLQEHNVLGYYIGPYQRGYKWKSKTIHDQVPVLLCDLYDAFLKSKTQKGNKEYYLQYITVKRTSQNGGFVFEVIDGQQRLTTITLLFTVLERYFELPNLAKKEGQYLLKYSRYSAATTPIFDTIYELAADESTKIENIEAQDKFYMYEAFKTIHTFLKLLKEQKDFITFIQDEVKIILNKEDEFAAAEEVFSSLNANKVPLTDAYLIKGLLLTKASRFAITDGIKKHFKEILDTRSLMAKIWDEMHNWFSRKEVSKYYFDHETVGMEAALKLIQHPPKKDDQSIIQQFKSKLKESSRKFENHYELFNQFHENILTPSDALDYLNKIKHLYKKLRNWYEDNNFYNCIGYYLHTQGKIDKLMGLDNNQLLKTLNEHLGKQLSYKDDVSTLRYDDKSHHAKIKALLLALSVFPEGIDRSKEQPYRFDFYAYSEEEWSLEHIFPQNPQLDQSTSQEDINWVMEQCKDEKKKSELIAKLENRESVSRDELSFIDEFPDVHSLGNMALLSKNVNSALSNGLFNTKRKILVRRINTGSFIPKHTIDIFSKMLEAQKNDTGELVSFDTNIIVWTEKDTTAHLQWMKHRILELKKEFTV